MLQKLAQDRLEDESIAAVSTILRSQNWDFSVQQKDKSGIDAEIEVIHGTSRTGLFLKCQVKAGRSYVSSETDEFIRVRIESKYLIHWHGSNVPIALFFYDPFTSAVYWKDIRDHLRVHGNLLKGTQESRVIEFHKKMDLLSPESVAVLEQVATGEFHYGFIQLEEDASEVTYSNRFPALPLPPVWVARTPVTNRRELLDRIHRQYAFTVFDGLLYSFADLRNSQCELRPYCEVGKVTPRIPIDVPINICSELLNLCRDLTLFRRGLDCWKERFYFPLSLLKNATTNKFSYVALQGKDEERTLIYSDNDSGKVIRKHHAVRISFCRELSQSFLVMDPDWHFTFPRSMSRLERKSKVISEKANLHNKEYLYLLHFWRQYLSNNSDRIRFAVSSNPIFGNVEFSSSPVEYDLPCRLTNDYFGPKKSAATNA